MKVATKLDALEHLEYIRKIVETGEFIEATISRESPPLFRPDIKGRKYLTLTIELVTKEAGQ